MEVAGDLVDGIVHSNEETSSGGDSKIVSNILFTFSCMKWLGLV
jgi:hypothetical protein